MKTETNSIPAGRLEQNAAKLQNYFAGQIEACGSRYQQLLDDHRGDEAVFEKVRANVYDIFRTVLSVAVKAGGGDPEAVRQSFLRKMEQIPSNWAEAYEKASRHGDAVRMQTEQVKLDTAAEIRTYFMKIWEGEA